MQMYLEETVSDFGHEVVATASDGLELLHECRDKHPDLVITDIKMPRMDGVRAVCEACQDSPMPVVFITGYDEQDRTLQAEKDCILVHLRKPVGEAELRKAIDLVLERFKQFQALQEEEPDLRRALVNRQRVEAAKRALFRSDRLSDREAFEYLRRLARDRRTTIAEAAEYVLSARNSN